MRTYNIRTSCLRTYFWRNTDVQMRTSPNADFPKCGCPHIRMSPNADVPKCGCSQMRTSPNTDFLRADLFLTKCGLQNPQIRTSPNADVAKCGCPQMRMSPYTDVAKYGHPQMRTFYTSVRTQILHPRGCNTYPYTKSVFGKNNIRIWQISDPYLVKSTSVFGKNNIRIW